uniref:SP1-Sep-5 n=1 Tax=Acanthosepion pharaonis TaxID=158019 RepID=R4G2D1_ACAPH
MLSAICCLLVLPLAWAGFGAPNKQIVAGRAAVNCEFPSIVHLIIKKKDGTFSCGGTLIDSLHVLTAAHCFGAGVKSVQVNIGTNENNKAGKFLLNAEEVITHGGFIERPMRNDIAIVKLSKRVQFSTCVKAATLAVTGQTFDHKTCVAAGWGKLGYELPSTHVLQKVSMPIIPQEDCARKMDYARLNNQHICAGDFSYGGASTCMGDSGGPLYCPFDGRMVLAGITSFGYDCAIDAAIFTSVATFRDWIDKNH